MGKSGPKTCVGTEVIPSQAGEGLPSQAVTDAWVESRVNVRQARGRAGGEVEGACAGSEVRGRGCYS